MRHMCECAHACACVSVLQGSYERKQRYYWERNIGLHFVRYGKYELVVQLVIKIVYNINKSRT